MDPKSSAATSRRSSALKDPAIIDTELGRDVSFEQLEADVLIGARQAVIIDRGKSDKVGVGNRFYVVRRGDAYSKVMGPASNVGQDDARFPARAIGEILVVQVGDSVSLGFVTRSVHEFGVGDRVIMRRGR